MDKGVLDTYEGLNLTDRQKKIFADVIVKRVVLSKREGIVTVYLTCSHVIAYREILLFPERFVQRYHKIPVLWPETACLFHIAKESCSLPSLPCLDRPC